MVLQETNEEENDPEAGSVMQVSNEPQRKAYPGYGIYARRMQRRNAPFLLAYKFFAQHHESIIYTLFVICFTLGCYLDRPSDHGFYFADAIRGKLLSTSWNSISELSHLWTFLEFDLTDMVYGNYFPGSDNGTILGYNYILNSIQLRQIRVNSETCSGPSWMSSLVPGQSTLLCYPEYRSDLEDRTSFGITNDQYFSWQNPDSSSWWNGELGNYGSEGYYLYLPRSNISEARSRIASAMHEGWLGLESRSVFIDFTLFNPMTKLLLRVKLLLEISVYGGIVKSDDFSVYKLQRYGGKYGSAALTFDVFFLVIQIFYVGAEVIALFQMRARYFLTRAAGLLHLFVACFVFAIISIRLESKNQIDSQVFLITSSEKSSISSFEKLQNLPYLGHQDDNLVAILFILMYGRLFLYAADVPGVSHLLTTIKRCIVEVIPLLSLVIINFVGFSMAFFVVFGLKMFEFRSVGSSFVHSALFLLGDSSLYSQMYLANKQMAPFLCAIFVISENILLFNLFIAILVHGYSITKADLDKEPLVMLTEAIESAVKLLSRSAMEQRSPSQWTREQSDLGTVSGNDPGPTSMVQAPNGRPGSGQRPGPSRDGRSEASPDAARSLAASGRPRRRDGSTLAFSAEQAAKTVASIRTVGGAGAGAPPETATASRAALQEGLLDAAQGMTAFDDIRTQLMGVSEKLNALTDFFLSQPGNKTEQHVDLINRKLDLLAEALLSTQYRGPDTPAVGPLDAGDSRSSRSLGGAERRDSDSGSPAGGSPSRGTGSGLRRAGMRTFGRGLLQGSGSGRDEGGKGSGSERVSLPGWTE